MKTVHLDYGIDGIDLDVTGLNVQILAPSHLHGLADEGAEFIKATRRPLAGAPLRETIGENDRVAIVVADGTRPLPSDRLLPWLFAELAHVAPEQFTIIIGTGTHRANTHEELCRMLGPEIVRRYRILNHDAFNPERLVAAGTSRFGYPVQFNRDYVEADKRIVLGFIEPHFVAGFSGGYKGVFPGVAGVDGIMHYHSVAVIGDPLSTWGTIEGNPTQAHVRAGGSLVPVDFCINVTLNRDKQITAFFCGEIIAAHDAGCAFVKSHVMIECPRAFPIVVTTNSGHPLDQNLYQSVKGMSAAAQIVGKGGLILAAARCNDGFPNHGNFKRHLFQNASVDAVLEMIHRPGFAEPDRWQTQSFALILKRARVGLFSELPDEEVSRAYMTPVHDLRQALLDELARIGQDAPVAILPEGPLSVPYLRA